MARRLANAHRSVVVGVFALGLYVIDVLCAGTASFHFPRLGQDTSFAAIALLGLPLAFSVGVSLWKAGSEQGAVLAYCDDLTGLLNRRAFVAKVQHLISTPGQATSA